MNKTRKEIEITLRQKMAQEFNKKQAEWMKSNDKLRKSWNEATQRCIELEEKVTELEEKVKQYEDWNNRLMSFMDIPEENRAAAIKDFIAQQKANQKFQTYIADSSLFKILNLWGQFV